MADHVKVTGHNIKWDHFDINFLAKGKTDYHCIIKETLFIQEFEPAFNVNGESERFINLFGYYYYYYYYYYYIFYC